MSKFFTEGNAESDSDSDREDKKDTKYKVSMSNTISERPEDNSEKKLAAFEKSSKNILNAMKTQDFSRALE